MYPKKAIVKGKIGNKAELSVSIIDNFNSPVRSLTWYWPTLDGRASTKKIKSDPRVYFSKSRRTLFIHDLRITDSGKYVCEAVYRKRGRNLSSSATIELVVSGKHVFNSP